MERCVAYIAQNPEEHKGLWREFLGLDENSRLEAEIGCGKGGFSVKTAESYAESGESAFLLAFDRIDNALVVGMERAAAQSTENLLFVHRDASALPKIFAPGEIDRLYINFCDPWPARRHETRRLTHPDFLAVYKALLSPTGSIKFKTDNKDLFLYSLKTLASNGWELTDTTYDLHAQSTPNITTEYEDKFVSLGMPIYYTEAGPKP
jgi:tRNA (guanine-N7-)-methyltransferase